MTPGQQETPPRVTFEHGEALDVLRRLPADSFEGIFCDPPYGLRSGLTWDGDVPPAEVWAECLRVLTPGAWVLAFGGRRTHHRLMTAMEAGGLELRDVLSWLSTPGPHRHEPLSAARELVVLARRPGPALLQLRRMLYPTALLHTIGARYEDCWGAASGAGRVAGGDRDRRGGMRLCKLAGRLVDEIAETLTAGVG